MFYNCSSLKSLNLSNFETSKATSFGLMFYNCNSLKFLDLQNFVTNSSKIMDYMFYGCSSLLSLNINTFNTSLVTNMINMFKRCTSLISLNLNSFNTPLLSKYENMFDNCNENLRVCFNESTLAEGVKTQLSHFIKDCSDDCFIGINHKFIIEKNKCIGLCNKDNTYRFEYNNICYEDCPKGTHTSFEEFICEEDINNINDKYIDGDFGINYFINESILSNEFSNKSIYYYGITLDQEVMEHLYSNRTFIDFPQDSKKFLINYFNLKQKDKIFIIIIDHLFHDINYITNIYDFKLILKNKTELNISYLKEDFFINIYLPIIDFTSSNFDYCLLFDKQGYDIYDKDSNFYNDICSPAYLGENDITIMDRKKYIYPNNINLCGINCEYKGINIEEKRITCECNLNINKNYSNEENIFLNEKDNGNALSHLSKNFKIFECYNLLTFEKLKKNYLFYTTLAICSINIITNSIFYVLGLSNIREFLINQVPMEEKIQKKTIKRSNKKQKTNNLFVNSNPEKRKNKKYKTEL